MPCIIVGYDVREPVEVRILKDRIEISSYPGLERSSYHSSKLFFTSPHTASSPNNLMSIK